MIKDRLYGIKTAVYYLFATGLTNVTRQNESKHRMRKLHLKNIIFLLNFLQFYSLPASALIISKYQPICLPR